MRERSVVLQLPVTAGQLLNRTCHGCDTLMIDFGLGKQEFIEQHLDKQPHVHRAALTATPIEWHDVDDILSVVEADHAALKLFHYGELAPQAYLDEGIEFGRAVTRLNKLRFYELLQRGATLVINQIEKYSVAARKLGLVVSRFTGMQTTSNAYVSFGGNGTFGKHWDTHDVVVLQLLGKKHWQVFAPGWPMPLSNQTSEKMQLQCPASPQLECVLEAGDLLYIPRGWWHNVTPMNEGSLHLSVGLYAPAMVDYIAWLCARHLPQHLSARRLVNAETLQSVPALMNIITTMAQDQGNLAAFTREIRQRERLVSEFNTALFAGSSVSQLPGNARLMLTTYGDNEGSVEMRINGGRIKLDSLGRRIVTALNDNLCLTFGELCGVLREFDPTIVAAAVLGLAQHELIDINVTPVLDAC